MCRCNEHKLSAVSWDRTVHTCKISGKALKQGSRTHSVLRQCSSHLQKYKAARMSRRTAVDQNVCGGGGDYQGWQFKICKLHNNWECAYSTQETFRFFMWLLYVQLLGDRTNTGFCVPLWSIRLNCQLMTKLETKRILQAQVCDDISTKNETGNQW